MTKTNTKFTKRMALETLLKIDAVKADANLIAYCENEISLLDKKAKAKSKPTKRQTENIEIVVPTLLAVLKEVDRATASQLAEKVASQTGLEITAPRVTAQLTKLKESGKVENVKEKGVSWYSVAPTA